MAKNSKKTNKIRQYPVKRSINFATVGVQKINMLIAIPAIVVIIALAALFAKFAVIDLMTKANEATAQVNSLRSQVDAGYARIDELQSDSEEYSHYTYSAFSSEELNRADRIKVLSMVQDIVLPAATLNSLTISGNVLTINLTAKSLEQINEIRKSLEKKTNMVSYCTVTTAATNKTVNVVGQITVYLTDKTEETESEDDATGEITIEGGTSVEGTSESSTTETGTAESSTNQSSTTKDSSAAESTSEKSTTENSSSQEEGGAQK